MFVATGRPSFAPDPLRELMRFHQRVRAQLARLEQLSDEVLGGDVDRDLERELDGHPGAAAGLAGFLRGPLSWHEEDEEELLLPRLCRVRHSVRLERSLDVIREGHRTLELESARVLACLDDLAAGLTGRPHGFATAVRGLAQQLEPHLRLEEQELLPLARLMLSDEELAQLARELSARREERRDADAP